MSASPGYRFIEIRSLKFSEYYLVAAAVTVTSSS